MNEKTPTEGNNKEEAMDRRHILKLSAALPAAGLAMKAMIGRAEAAWLQQKSQA